MATIVEMPRLSDTMTEGTLAGWKKQIGDMVKAGDALAEIETDKAVMVFESFDSGVLLAVLLTDGDTVPLGTPMAILGKAGEDVSALVADAQQKIAAAKAGGAPAAPKDEPEEDAPKDEPEVEAAKDEPKVEAAKDAPKDEPKAEKPAPKAAPKVAASAPSKDPAPAPTDADGNRIAASPLARRLAQQRGLDLAGVPGTGPKGRIVADDLDGLAPARKLSARVGRAAKKVEDEVVRVTQMRKTIAKRLTESVTQAPHFYLNITIDAGRLVALRTELNDILAEQATADGGKPLKLSFNDFVMRGCVVALMKHPLVNSGWEGTASAAGIRRFGGVHLGFAVALPDGLISPVIRDAQELGIVELAEKTRELAGRARDGKLEAAEYQGNSFCVSNLGMFGIDHFTAIINAPAACILAVGALVEAPVVKNGQLAVGQRMTMTLSCDHRVVDGATGAAFLQDLRKVLEAPTILLV